jgi:hypothetical protein
MRFMIVQNCRYALNGITVVDFNKDQNLDGYDVKLCNRLVELGLAKRVDDEKKDSKESEIIEEPKKTRGKSKKVSK